MQIADPAIHWVLRPVNWELETYFFWQICAAVIAVKQRLQVLHLASKNEVSGPNRGSYHLSTLKYVLSNYILLHITE